MVLVINGQEASWNPQGNTVGEIRQEVGKWALNKGHALWEFKVDGVVVEGEDCEQELAETETVEVITRDMAEVIDGLATETVNYLPRLIAGLKTVSDLVYEGEEQEAIAQFQRVLEGIDWTFTAMRLCRKISSQIPNGVAPDNALHFDPGHDRLQAAESALNEMEEALRSQDLILFADLIQSSLCTTLEQWLDKLSHHQ